MSTASQIIALFGKPTDLSRETEIPLTTIISWGEVNSIPRWWHTTLLALAMKKGVSLSTDDFPKPEERLPRPAKKQAA